MSKLGVISEICEQYEYKQGGLFGLFDAFKSNESRVGG